jgi:hypothetical protein
MFEETFPVEFIGGSLDGGEILATAAPEYFEVRLDSGVTELYERQNEAPPIVYLQAGYAKQGPLPAH